MIGYGILVPLQEAVATIASSRGMSEKAYMRSLLRHRWNYEGDAFEQDHMTEWNRLKHYLKDLITPIPYGDGIQFLTDISAYDKNVFIGGRVGPCRSAMSKLAEQLDPSYVKRELESLGFGHYEPELYYSTNPALMDLDGIPLSKPKTQKLN
jgi:hypothetical protein